MRGRAHHQWSGWGRGAGYAARRAVRGTLAGGLRAADGRRAHRLGRRRWRGRGSDDGAAPSSSENAADVRFDRRHGSRRPPADPSDRALGRRRAGDRLAAHHVRVRTRRRRSRGVGARPRARSRARAVAALADRRVDRRRRGAPAAVCARRSRSAGSPRSCRTARPRSVTASATQRSLAQELAPLRPDYAGPTGLQTVVLRALGDAGIPGAGLWAQVPQYVSGSPSPPAIRALLAPARRDATTSTSTCGRSTSGARRTCGASRPASRPGPT